MFLVARGSWDQDSYVKLAFGLGWQNRTKITDPQWDPAKRSSRNKIHMAALQISTGPQPQESTGHRDRQKDQYGSGALSPGARVWQRRQIHKDQ